MKLFTNTAIIPLLAALIVVSTIIDYASVVVIFSLCRLNSVSLNCMNIVGRKINVIVLQIHNAIVIRLYLTNFDITVT